jgi:hypothetical protein
MPGQTIYVDDASKYYWIDEKGRRVFIAKEQLKPKVKTDDKLSTKRPSVGRFLLPISCRPLIIVAR